MIAALGWGAVAASSLVLGALLGLARRWPERGVGVVLAFGAGALISAVSFDLAQDGVRLGGSRYVALGLAVGALTYFVADLGVERVVMRRRTRSSAAQDTAENAGPALALGALLDGVPEQLVLGIGLATGGGVSVGLLAAIFVSNLPEAIGSATEMRRAGRAPKRIAWLWVVVAGICVSVTVAGYAVADNVSPQQQAATNGFAAGALLVMLIDSMIPEAASKAGKVAGLVTVLGFAVAAGLSGID
ncbi:MAG: ZIP family metal transporter [Nocardioidaceae bacterium]